MSGGLIEKRGDEGKIEFRQGEISGMQYLLPEMTISDSCNFSS